ncbi:MAG: hypothetical protein KKB50_21515 [Planctomycetes bacterium]|nr:hypothetical protein [Planctomycetota bacterium]
MEHKLIPTTWRTKEGLAEVIRTHEQDGWSVAALGSAFGGERLVLLKDGQAYEHEVLSALWKTPEGMAKIIAEKEHSGWQTCAIGECFGSNLLILKRRK